MTPAEVDAAFDALAPDLAALRVLTGFEAPSDTPENDEAAFTALAERINPGLRGIAKALDAAEAPRRPSGPAAMMMAAAAQRTGGAPDPLVSLYDPAATTKAEAQSQIEARRRYFAYWLSTVEGFKTRAAARAAKLC